MAIEELKMSLRVFVWFGLVFLLGSAAADDIPFVFNESSYDLGRYNSDQLANISASSLELAGVPPISAPQDSEILMFPDSGDNKTVGEIKNEFDYRVWQKKGQVLFNQGRYDESIEACDRAIELDPRSADAWYIKGIILKTEAKAAFARAGMLRL